MVAKTNNFVLIRDGAVDVRMATDIKGWFPSKEVTVVHCRVRVMPKFHDKLHEIRLEKVDELGYSQLSICEAQYCDGTASHRLRQAHYRERCNPTKQRCIEDNVQINEGKDVDQDFTPTPLNILLSLRNMSRSFKNMPSELAGVGNCSLETKCHRESIDPSMAIISVLAPDVYEAFNGLNDHLTPMYWAIPWLFSSQSTTNLTKTSVTATSAAMMHLRQFLPMFLGFALYTVYIFAYISGLIPRIQAVVQSGRLPIGPNTDPANLIGHPSAPGGLIGIIMGLVPGLQKPVEILSVDADVVEEATKLMDQVTGIKMVDKMIAGILVFLNSIVDGNSPITSMWGIKHAGSIGAMFMIIYLESVRRGSRGKMGLHFPSIIGIAAQTLGYSVVVPLWSLTHLVQSRLSHIPRQEDVRIHPMEGLALPFSMILGYIIPTLAMALPTTFSPAMIQRYASSSQRRMLLWFIWPISVSFFQGLFAGIPAIYRKFVPKRVIPGLLARRNRNGLRLIYWTAEALAAVPHIFWLSMMLVNQVAPGIFHPNVNLNPKPASALYPVLPWISNKAQSVGEGVFWTLQWDYYIAAFIFWCWCFKQYRIAHNHTGTTIGYIGVAPRTLGMMSLGGLVSSGIRLLAERDELLMDGLEENEKRALK
ncbi:hypothetical protein KEM54_000628 [Ascosphaera aggregata]|nr:hypothetical protein KEM54_000628 [Ascosphaera aggregata]